MSITGDASGEAEAAVQSKIEIVAQKIMEHIERAGKIGNGVTAWGLAEEMSSDPQLCPSHLASIMILTVRPRLTKLKAQKKIFAGGRAKSRYTGASEAVWYLWRYS